MKAGDLIYDSCFGQYALVIGATVERSSYFTVFYEDGKIDTGIRSNDSEIEIINESG